MIKVYIGIGSNLGNRIDNLRLALEKLRILFKNLQESIIIETDAIIADGIDQSSRLPYLNMVVSCDTDLSPEELLLELKSIEKRIGRDEMYIKWSPRIIDLDILLYGDEVIQTPNLTVPHPELNNRTFFQHLLALLGVDDFGLQNDSFIGSFVASPSIIGIVNVTNDSFSDGGKYNKADKAIEHALKLVKDGASIVDIGAQSTRPGTIIKSANDEITALTPVLGMLPEIDISIDTFRHEVVEWALKKHNISWVNDVTSSLETRSLEMIRDYEKKLCVMHSLIVPPDSKIILPIDCDPIKEIVLWGEKKIDQLLRLKYNLDNIILDPGIGFGKNYQQNISIIKRVGELKRTLGVQILLGHSRKSYISAFSKSLAPERDIETIAISSLIAKDIDYLRVHDVSSHMKTLVAQQSIVSYDYK